MIGLRYTCSSWSLSTEDGMAEVLGDCGWSVAVQNDGASLGYGTILYDFGWARHLHSFHEICSCLVEDCRSFESMVLSCCNIALWLIVAWNNDFHSGIKSIEVSHSRREGPTSGPWIVLGTSLADLVTAANCDRPISGTILGQSMFKEFITGNQTSSDLLVFAKLRSCSKINGWWSNAIWFCYRNSLQSRSIKMSHLKCQPNLPTLSFPSQPSNPPTCQRDS